MKQVVLNLGIHDDKDKRKALKAVSGLMGINSIAMDMKGKKLTVIGDVDPITVVDKLRKLFPTDIVSVGQPKGAEKKEETKKDEKKKDPNEYLAELAKAYQAYNNAYNMPALYYVQSAEENPNSCVIC